MRALMCVGRNVETFLRPGKMAELESLLDLTIQNGLPREESLYSKALRDAGAKIVITGWGSPTLTERVWAENPQLKYLCNLTGAVRHVVDKAVIEKGITVTNWGTLIGPTVAEGALNGILACLRRSVRVWKEVHLDDGWRSPENNTVESLFYQNVGLHGFGVIAQELVKLLAPFKCTISSYSPHAPDHILEAFGVRRQTDLRKLYSENRVISIHASKTPENFHIVDAEVLAGMPDGGVLVNTARGAIVDTEALVAELKRERIYASLDVYEEEPLPVDSPLRGLRNAHLTCHTAGPTPDRMIDFGDEAVENIRRFLKGQPLTNLVTAEKYDLIT